MMQIQRIVAMCLIGASVASIGFAQDSGVTEEMAQKAFQDADWKQAVTAYGQLAEKEPSNAGYWSRLGYAQYMLKRYEAAASAYERAAEIQPMVSTMYNIACSYSLLDRKEQALDWLMKAAENGLTMPATLLQDEDLKNIRSESRFGTIVERVKKNETPCEYDPDHRRFDFWVGEWSVKNANGQFVGNSSVKNILGGCVIFENWSGRTGYEGKSFNFVDPTTGKWRQTWVDSRGGKIEFEGEFEGKNLVYHAKATDQSGKEFTRKLTFFDQGANQVRQFSQRSYDNGLSWSTEYDFTYVRKTGEQGNQ